LDLAGNLSNSFEYAKKLFTDFGRLLILVVLNVIPVVNWIVVGYAASVLRGSPSADTPPRLDNYGKLFVEGAKIFFASLVYMIIPLILIVAGVGSLFSTIITGASPSYMQGAFTPSMIGLLTGTGIVLLLLGVLIAFVMLVLLAAGIAHMVKTGKFSKAFAFGEILDIIKKIGWGKYIAWIILVAVIALIVGAITSAIPYVGWLISVIIGPGVIVFFFRSLGLLYSE
jgi:hypothetical protein